MRKPSLPNDEHIAVENWARQADPALWAVVPRARPFMLRCAAMKRAACAFYGSIEDMRPLYEELAEQMVKRLGVPMADALPVWERHFLSPVTSAQEHATMGMACVKCGSVAPEYHLRAPGPCPVAVSGPPRRWTAWSCSRPIWVWLWPDGQRQQRPADFDEHQQAQRYEDLVVRRSAFGLPRPLRDGWLNRHLRRCSTPEDEP